MPRRLAAALSLSCLALLADPAQALLWPSDVARLERELGSADVELRRRAAGRLGELGPRVAARLAAHALDDPDVEVRLAAAQAAGLLGLTGFAERVLGWLTEPDARLRLEAIELLTQAPTVRAVGPLTRALSDAEPAVRAAAAHALGRAEAAEAVSGLLGRLDDSAVEVKLAVIRALSRLGDTRAVVPLIAKVEDPRPEVRRAVARALGELGDRRADSALVLLLRDADVGTRAAAVAALGDPAAVPSLAAVLEADEAASVRQAAIESLSSIGTPEAVAALLRQLGRRSDEREVLVSALGQLGVKAAPALRECLGAEPPGDKLDGCALGLALAQPTEAGSALREAVRRGRVGTVAALSALAKTGHPEALALVLEQLGHAEAAVRQSALAAAAMLLDPRRPDGRAVEPLERAFASARERRAEQLELLRLLGRTGSPRAARLLGPIAGRADDLELRVSALEALADLPSDVTEDVLLRALSDREPAVRLAAALAVRRSAPRGRAADLLERLERAASQDRLALALALPGAFTGTVSPALVERLVRLLERAAGGERDGLLEALAHAPRRLAGAFLDRLAASPDPLDRRKVAEVAALEPGSVARLVRLARDGDPNVRANAVWSLGVVGGATELPLLEQAFRDRDPSTASNAVAAYARVGRRVAREVRGPVCRAVDAPRAAVRASALLAARFAGVRCAGARERQLLGDDPSPQVRRSAALLIRDVAPTLDDRRALRRCAAEEPSGAAALACSAPPERVEPGAGRALVFVVPVAEASATPGAPFALLRPDGLVRQGAADRRGAAYEVALPDGSLTLAVPAAFDH